MQTSATALTTASPQGAQQAAAPASGASEFLTLLNATGRASAKKAATKANPALNAKAAPKVAPVNLKTAETVETAAKTEKSDKTTKTGKVATETPALAAAELRASMANAAVTSTALPAALIAGATAAAKATAPIAAESDAAVPVAEAATKDTATKSRANRAAAKRDPGEAARAMPDAKTPDVKADPADRVVTKPAEAVAAAPKPQPETAPPAATLLPASHEPSAHEPTFPPPGVTETRVSLGRETAAQTGVAAPMLAIRIHIKDGSTKAIEIRLDPPDLGEVNVKLETGSDGRLKAVLSADNAAAFELLKREGGALESALRDAGVELGEDAISFTLNEDNASSDTGRHAGDTYHRATSRQDGAIADALPAARWRDGLIDIMA